MNTPTSQYATADINSITAITASGTHPLRVERDETGRRVIFVFAKTPELERLLDDFWSNKLQLPALQLLTQFKTIKAQMHNTK